MVSAIIRAMAEWNIQIRAHRCQSCSGKFEDKQGYHTLLFTDVGQLMRLDVCGKCWKNQYRHGANERRGFISHWQGIYLVPPTAPPEAIQKDTAETLLRKLIERDDPDPRYQACCYILAVMLERKRIIKVKDQLIQNGQRVFVYEHPKSGDLFAVADPQLKLDQLESVQRDVAHLLEHGPVPLAPMTLDPETSTDVPVHAHEQEHEHEHAAQAEGAGQGEIALQGVDADADSRVTEPTDSVSSAPSPAGEHAAVQPVGS